MSDVVIDTSTWARRDQPRVARLVSSVMEQDRVALVRPLILELLRSARDVADLSALAEDYASLHTVDLTPAIEARALAVQRHLAERGYHRGPSPVDLIAAAAAESVGAELWHCDRHFELIAEVTGQPVRRVGR